ncbi:MAG TPA: RebB family R body protein [Acetobacteraceae bacterium]|nr:RebB family R body protein [Acetobacteraceae bacterium]
MADPTPMNGQVTDSVAQANTKVLGDAPAFALASDYQSMAHAVGLSMQNAVAAQRKASMIGGTVATQAVSLIFGVPLAAGVRGTNELFSGNALAETLIQLRTLPKLGR